MQLQLERNRQYIVVRSLHGTRVDGEAIGQQYATKVNHREDSHANAALGWSDEIEYGIHGQPYIELTRRVVKGEQITADYGEWFDYAQHIDPIRVGEHREEDDTLEMGETEKRLSFGEATGSPDEEDDEESKQSGFRPIAPDYGTRRKYPVSDTMWNSNSSSRADDTDPVWNNSPV